MNAPNTRSQDIGRGAPYHNAGMGTVDSGDHTAALCRRCKTVADPAHVCDGPRDSLSVFCAAHCPKCTAFRAELVKNPAAWLNVAHQARLAL